MPPAQLRLRLSVMMFGQYLALGTWLVTLATYLLTTPDRGGLNFSPSLVSWTYSTLAIAGLLAPLCIGLLADRLFAAEKLMAFMHLSGALLLVAAAAWCADSQPRILETFRCLAEGEAAGTSDLWSELEKGVPLRDLRGPIDRVNDNAEMKLVLRETFLPLFAVMFVYAQTVMVTLTVSSLIVFRNVSDAKKHFGAIRLWGTVGWIFAGVVAQLALDPISPQVLWLPAAYSVVMGVYSFWLPHTPPSTQSKSFGEAIGLPALKMFRDHDFRVLFVCGFCIALVQQFYTLYANKFLVDIGTPSPVALQTLAQVSEVVCMALFPIILHYLGVRRTMLIGLVGWSLRNAAFATLSVPFIMSVGLPLHGLSYAFFMVVASIVMDQKAPPHLRGSVQAIYTFGTLGAGNLIGNIVAGTVVQRLTYGADVNWGVVWWVPAAGALLVAFYFMLRYGRDEPAKVPVIHGQTPMQAQE